MALDLTARKREVDELMFPANLVFHPDEQDNWFTEHIEHYGLKSEEYTLWKSFKEDVLRTMTGYKIPVITLDKTAPRETVCKVFENVNTGGVSLTVFELVTTTFATYDFDLRGNWNDVVRPSVWTENKDIKTDVIRGVDETTFLTAMTFYTTYRAKRAGDKGSTSCKKRDVLNLRFEDYEANRLASRGIRHGPGIAHQRADIPHA